MRWKDTEGKREEEEVHRWGARERGVREGGEMQKKELRDRERVWEKGEKGRVNKRDGKEGRREDRN